MQQSHNEKRAEPTTHLAAEVIEHAMRQALLARATEKKEPLKNRDLVSKSVQEFVKIRKSSLPNRMFTPIRERNEDKINNKKLNNIPPISRPISYTLQPKEIIQKKDVKQAWTARGTNSNGNLLRSIKDTVSDPVINKDAAAQAAQSEMSELETILTTGNQVEFTSVMQPEQAVITPNITTAYRAESIETLKSKPEISQTVVSEKPDETMPVITLDGAFPETQPQISSELSYELEAISDFLFVQPTETVKTFTIEPYEILDPDNQNIIETTGTGELKAKVEFLQGEAGHGKAAATDIVEFAMLAGLPVTKEVASGIVEVIAVNEVQPLPPVCIEVMTAVKELAPEPTEIASDMLNAISKTIDRVVEQRQIGDETAPLTEQQLQQQCIELFEYLGIAYTPEIIMEFVAGIMQAKQTTQAAIKQIEATEEDGTREAGQEIAPDDSGLFWQIEDMLAQALGKVSLNSSELALAF